MKSISILALFLSLSIGCSVKTKDAVYQHQGRANDQSNLEKDDEQGTYKKTIDNQQFYQKAIDKKSDLHNDVLKPLSQIVLNTQHLDDPYLYKRKDLSYSLQLFQNQYLMALNKDSSKVSDITKSYLNFLNYKCTTDMFTDCKSHRFLSQDSNTTGILLTLAQNERDFDKKINFLKLAIALKNSGNSDQVKKTTIAFLLEYIKSNTKTETKNKIQSIAFNSTSTTLAKFNHNLLFFYNALKTLSVATEEFSDLQGLLIYQGIKDVLGSDLYNFLFKNLSNDEKDPKTKELLVEQWYRILSIEEASNNLSWKNLKSKLPANIKIETQSLKDLKEKGLDALLIYQVAQDLSSQKPLADLESKKQTILKNPELTYQIFQTQLKLQFFTLAAQSFRLLQAELEDQKKSVRAPQELLDFTLQRVNPQLRAIWMGYEKVVTQYMYYITQTFGATSSTAIKFRQTQEALDTSLKVYVTTPMMLITLYNLDKKQYKEKIIITGATKSTAELDASLLLVEVLQGRMTSFFYVKEGVKETPLTQYQILYALAYTTIMDLPKLFGTTTTEFVNAFSKVNVKISEKRLTEIESHLENIGFGSYDTNSKYARKEGNVHNILKLCEHPTSSIVSTTFSKLQNRTFLGRLDRITEENAAFRNLAIYNQENIGNYTISEMIEFVRSEIDPLIDMISIVEKVTNVSITDKRILQDRRQRLLSRAFELEKKVSTCALKLNQIEKDRQNRFFKAEYNYIKNTIAIGHWIDSQKQTPYLPEDFRKIALQSQSERISFANEWLIKTVYAKLQYRAPNLYNELKSFKFFDLNEAQKNLVINSRTIDAYYRLALWLEEPAQQKEIRLSISYPESFRLAIREFYSYSTGNFDADTTPFNPSNEFLERDLRRISHKNFDGWDIGRNYQIALRDILKLKTSRWKMATALDWDASAWMKCKNDCLTKRHKQMEDGLMEVIETNMDIVSHFQVTPEEAVDLRMLNVHSHLNVEEQFRDPKQYIINPDELFTFHVANTTTASSSVKYMGLLDHVMRFVTSHYLGTRPLYSLHGEIFKDSGRSSQNQLAEAESATINLKGQDLIGRRDFLLDLQDENIYASDPRVITLSLIGQSMAKKSDEQFLIPLPENLDLEMRSFVIAPTVRELELRQVFYSTVSKLESSWKKPTLTFALNIEPMNDPWLVSSSYVGRIQEQEREFHRLTKGVFQLEKWFGPQADKK